MAKALVAYFSASGITKKLAGSLAAAIDAAIFEIEPEQKYTDEDLDWQDHNSRSSVEMKDRSCRPKIASKVPDMSQYEVVFVGFPVWWYREPSIIDTFAESYDFSGKTIVPFATSGSSGIGDSGKNIGELAKGANVVEGKRFSSSTSAVVLKDWAQEYLKGKI
ncbi:MAG: flavodoxin [Oribacterium sp.]|nr:flavodoxin [Oribacterium sp.]